MSERLRIEVELQETTFLPREVNINNAYLRCRRLASCATHYFLVSMLSIVGGDRTWDMAGRQLILGRPLGKTKHASER